ncbi:hypothetical protein HYALB_00005624 [Hymenoscyphus albidus]|uniref:SWIM-type domain-containing protein n=1 Tax=Hymenoscyphus albidus TaxID=595503 RepID=A0A9N9Q6H7_9HELO|nr:hypothetical protein HYALB_00005624 [Hymenoscyphus albidus]
MDPTLRPIPTPRHLLTSLINTLTTPPPPAPAPPSTQQPTINTPYPHSSKETTTNPLRNLSASHRALLTTLHVLFPPGMVLQSLDLLDRGLVTRIMCVPSEAHSTPPQEGEMGRDFERGEGQVWPPQANIHLPLETLNDAVPEKKEERGKNNVIYRVSSSQPQKSRFSHSHSGAGTGTGQVYTVRLQAWNCSCAAFAFSAFPAAHSSRPWEHERDYGDEEEMGGKREEMGGKREEEEWEFGDGCLDGLNGEGVPVYGCLDGLNGEGVPVCKHLLACLLGERWRGVVGGLVKEREVGREEMAGLGAE